jgi:hypothetical protein
MYNDKEGKDGERGNVMGVLRHWVGVSPTSVVDLQKTTARSQIKF